MSIFDGEKNVATPSLSQQFLSPTLQKAALPVASLVLIMFFVIQGPILFPDQWAHWETITLIFAMMVLTSVLLSPQAFDIPAWRVFMWFGIALAGALVMFKILFSGFRYDAGFPVGTLLPTAIFQLFVITYSEESFFRGFLSDVGKGRPGLGVLMSAILFSVFHLAAYSSQGLNFAAFGVAFVMGLALGFVYLATRNFASIGVVWGIHAGWNLALLFG
jgi:membrane protease YdiL (CAAX protease family)